MPRRFTSRQRAVLFSMSDGLCVVCGMQLDGADFAADHRTPWSQGGATDLVNGQATCRKCNQRKGTNMLLPHQIEFQNACRTVKTSTSLNTIIAHTICGGGKSAYGPIGAAELIPSRAERVVWFNPRQNLRSQAEEVFQSAWLRSIIGDPGEIRQAINQADPVRDKIGYTVTYTAITEALALGNDNPHLQAFSRYRMLCFLDEFQHIELGGKTHQALLALFRAAPSPPILVLMGGHLTRYDGNRVAFLDYLPMDKNGICYVDTSNNERQRFIRCTLGDATRDRQLIKINFELHDVSNAAWDVKDPDGTVYSDELDSFDDASQVRTSRALMTAVSTDFAQALVVRAVEFWLARRRVNKRSKLAIVCARISHAKEIARILQQMGIRVGLATSEDDDEAEKVIQRFRGKRGPELNVLVAVGKVYEGMDCPEADVLCCLTHIRSREWIEQMIHRVTRRDRDGLPWEQQFATIFAPKDRFFLEIMAEIKKDQAPYVDELLVIGSKGGGTSGTSDFRPRESAIGEASAQTFNDPPVEGQDYTAVEMALKQSGLFGTIPIVDGKKFADSLRQQQQQQQSQPQSPQPQPASTKPALTPSQREEKLRKEIVELQRSGYNPSDPQSVERTRERGKRFFKIFKKTLPNCTEKELQAIKDASPTWI